MASKAMPGGAGETIGSPSQKKNGPPLVSGTSEMVMAEFLVQPLTSLGAGRLSSLLRLLSGNVAHS
jgi:hypothetical protein